MHLFWDDFLTKLLVMKKYAVPVICVLLAIISFMLSDNVASFENQDGSIRWSEVIITVISALGLLITFLNVIVLEPFVELKISGLITSLSVPWSPVTEELVPVPQPLM